MADVSSWGSVRVVIFDEVVSGATDSTLVPLHFKQSNKLDVVKLLILLALSLNLAVFPSALM